MESTSEIALARRSRPASATTVPSTGLADAASPRPATLRSRVTNNPSYLAGAATSQWAQNRRRRDLVRILIQAIGQDSVTDLKLIAVKRAAELTVAAERARAILLTSSSIGPNDLEMLSRLEGAAERATRSLGIRDNGARPHVPLRDQLAAEIEAEADADEAEPAA